MKTNLTPNQAEIEFLTLSYNKFYDIFEEIFDDSFWKRDKYERFSKIKQAFSIYAELLNYEPIKVVIDYLKTSRPPMESEIGSELFKFIRNVIIHFPYFNSWNEVWIKKTIINWSKKGMSIDKFLKKYEGREEVKYRFWEEDKKQMTYLSIKFPPQYNDDSKIYLKDIISEKEGIKFSLILMRQIMDTQVEKNKI